MVNKNHQHIEVKITDEIQLTQTEKSSNDIEKKLSSSSVEQNNKTKNKHCSYRPQIDGLRTIAITIVIIYHAFPESMPGGFIGVDVFFVISGFLISQNIIKQTIKNQFSYINFYSRRIKRIYPALLVVLLFVLIVTLVFYHRKELDFALKTSIASTVFGANIQVLTHEKGYFDPDVHVNPLLHLWSLGVEEQFYIFWPCLISIGLNVFKQRTFLVLALYTAFSFVFGIVSVYNNPKFAFYFPVCRFWQMAVGGLIAYLNVKFNNTKLNNALSIIGTVSILATVWIIDDQSLFPGFWALVPTLAAAFIIQAGPEPFINKKILSSRLFVFVGKISYPMYLWHWPLLVFSRYLYPEGSTSIFSNLYFIIALTVLLSIGTYYFIENPIRRTKSKKIVLILFVGMMIFGCVSFGIFKIARIKNSFYDSQTINALLQKAENQIKPRDEDFLLKDGKMHPNLSKSKNRKPPTIEKINIANWELLYDLDSNDGHEIILEKDVVQGSKYYVEDKPFLNIFQVANQGSQNQIFLVGDSHALRLAYRFQQLYYDSVTKNKTKQFPTVVSIIKTGNPLVPDSDYLNFVMKMIKKFKPKRVLMLAHWLIYYCKNPQLQREPKCSYQLFQENTKKLVSYMKEVEQLGVQVSTLTINFHHRHLNSGEMTDIFGIIEENTKAISRKEFRIKFKRMFDIYESNMKKENIDVIDLADNLCFEDTCQVLSPQGYSIYTDDHHYAKYYARHWLSAVDHLTEF